MALIASGYAFSLIAPSMMGFNASMAVFGRPLLTASSTFFHWLSHFAAMAAVQRASIVANSSRAARRFFMASLLCGCAGVNVAVD